MKHSQPFQQQNYKYDGQLKFPRLVTELQEMAMRQKAEGKVVDAEVTLEALARIRWQQEQLGFHQRRTGAQIEALETKIDRDLTQHVRGLEDLRDRQAAEIVGLRKELGR